ncbi:hypothetical protein STIAU_3724 [Stigmatella aurantiaca DW4/3-1]|uniref:Uncharacterized protein n=1 Tax=Stigmatella aurantiaca (strain DW4/3-1) TaxID=378806 RepID=Q09CB5_STIAD|nr:hypothetical protein STIAU_3724 [Stigmatella aurantiaca DW4/3-1]
MGAGGSTGGLPSLWAQAAAKVRAHSELSVAIRVGNSVTSRPSLPFSLEQDTSDGGEVEPFNLERPCAVNTHESAGLSPVEILAVFGALRQVKLGLELSFAFFSLDWAYKKANKPNGIRESGLGTSQAFFHRMREASNPRERLAFPAFQPLSMVREGCGRIASPGMALIDFKNLPGGAQTGSRWSGAEEALVPGLWDVRRRDEQSADGAGWPWAERSVRDSCGCSGNGAGAARCWGGAVKHPGAHTSLAPGRRAGHGEHAGARNLAALRPVHERPQSGGLRAVPFAVQLHPHVALWAQGRVPVPAHRGPSGHTPCFQRRIRYRGSGLPGHTVGFTGALRLPARSVEWTGRSAVGRGPLLRRLPAGGRQADAPIAAAEAGLGQDAADHHLRGVAGCAQIHRPRQRLEGWPAHHPAGHRGHASGTGAWLARAAAGRRPLHLHRLGGELGGPGEGVLSEGARALLRGGEVPDEQGHRPGLARLSFHRPGSRGIRRGPWASSGGHAPRAAVRRPPSASDAGGHLPDRECPPERDGRGQGVALLHDDPAAAGSGRREFTDTPGGHRHAGPVALRERTGRCLASR